MEEPTGFIDAEAYVGNNEQITIRDIILRHYARILTISSKEFRPGYWKRMPVGGMGSSLTVDTYVDDSRDAYVNAVDALHDALLPQFDKVMEEASNKIYTQEEEWYNQNKIEEKGGVMKDPYIWEKLKLRRKLFQELSKFMFRVKYLEKKASEATMH